MTRKRRNVEIKLRLPQAHDLAARLRHELGARNVGLLQQEDVFFHVPRGRLKLRLQPQRPAQLIAYERADAAQLRASDYRIVECDDGEGLLQLLTETLGEMGRVRKRRQLWMLDNVRLHLDDVEGLGTFLEIEAVLDESHAEEACHVAARAILGKLGLEQVPAESAAYIDLLGMRP
jgi:predicted adenylyl cyclase CyaB